MRESDIRIILEELAAMRRCVKEMDAIGTPSKERICHWMPEEMAPQIWQDIKTYYKTRLAKARKQAVEMGIELYTDDSP